MNAAWRVRIGRIPLLEAARELDLRGVDMGHGEALQLAAFADDVHGAPVGEGRDRKTRHRFQGLFVIERGAEGSAGGGEKGRLLAGVVRRFPSGPLFVVE